MNQCEICEEIGYCKYCPIGNPCLGCSDYNEETDNCISDGGCGKEHT